MGLYIYFDPISGFFFFQVSLAPKNCFFHMIKITLFRILRQSLAVLLTWWWLSLNSSLPPSLVGYSFYFFFFPTKRLHISAICFALCELRQTCLWEIMVHLFWHLESNPKLSRQIQHRVLEWGVWKFYLMILFPLQSTKE